MIVIGKFPLMKGAEKAKPSGGCLDAFGESKGPWRFAPPPLLRGNIPHRVCSKTGTLAAAHGIYFPIKRASFSLISGGTLVLSVRMADFRADPHLQGLWSSKTRTAARISF